MMKEVVEFDAVIEGKSIVVPDEYLRGLTGGQSVHVVLRTSQRTNVVRRDTLQEMMENPIFIPDFKAPSRDEMHDGR